METHIKPKGAKKAISCQVVSVNGDKLNLKNLVDKKTIYKVLVWSSNPNMIDGQEI